MEKTLINIRFNRKNKLDKNGLGAVQLELRLNGKRKFIDTKVKVKPEFWDSNKSRVKNHHSNAIQLNQRLNQILNEFEEFELSFLNTKRPFDLAMFDNIHNQNKFQNFNDFFKAELDNANISDSTKRSHQTTLNRLNEFQTNIPFEGINFEFLHDFERFLRSEKCDIQYKNRPAKKLSQNTIHKYFKNIKTYVNLAINKDLMDLNKYPFRKFKVKKIDGEKQFLTPYEIEQIENCVLSGKNAKLQITKDLYLFSCYTGLRFSDVMSLEIKHLVKINNESWLIKKIDKTLHSTEVPVKIPIDTLFGGKAKKIIFKYFQLGTSFVFPRVSNQHLNRSLDIIAPLSGIDKPITFHSARHTTATYLLYKGANITTVQKILGHSKISTTQIYSHILDSGILNDLKAINF